MALEGSTQYIVHKAVASHPRQTAIGLIGLNLS